MKTKKCIFTKVKTSNIPQCKNWVFLEFTIKFKTIKIRFMKKWYFTKTQV